MGILKRLFGMDKKKEEAAALVVDELIMDAKVAHKNLWKMPENRKRFGYENTEDYFADQKKKREQEEIAEASKMTYF